MMRRWPLLIAMVGLGYAIWRSPDFTTIAAGVAIFLFGMLFLQEGFTAFTGGVLEKLLRASTTYFPKSP